ncbi:hypothetical protein MNV49_006802 [Pseudohyphozyma bogoriensis]|nr:hypothetical protein MNV49_006802 [Pseudohyphozyma bogoriensis]
MAAKALPLIVCGRTTKVASAVQAALAPEYSIMHLILSPEEGVEHLPLLLSNQAPPPPKNPARQLGTQDYSSPPQAILLGGGYEDSDIEVLRKACRDTTQKVPWLKCDPSVPTPPLGPEYGKAVVERAKKRLRELREEGKLGKEDGIFLY